MPYSNLTQCGADDGCSLINWLCWFIPLIYLHKQRVGQSMGLHKQQDVLHTLFWTIRFAQRSRGIRHGHLYFLSEIGMNFQDKIWKSKTTHICSWIFESVFSDSRDALLFLFGWKEGATHCLMYGWLATHTHTHTHPLPKTLLFCLPKNCRFNPEILFFRNLS